MFDFNLQKSQHGYKLKDGSWELTEIESLGHHIGRCECHLISKTDAVIETPE